MPFEFRVRLVQGPLELPLLLRSEDPRIVVLRKVREGECSEFDVVLRNAEHLETPIQPIQQGLSPLKARGTLKVFPNLRKT